MKRNFVEPQMEVMAVNMKENIAHSTKHTQFVQITISKKNQPWYCVDANGIVSTGYTDKYNFSSGNGHGERVNAIAPCAKSC